MSTTAVFALMEAGHLDFTTAKKIISKLEANGMTIYKKKVFKNGKRPISSKPFTPELAAKIRDYFRENPNMTQQEIAHVFQMNSGRVNEALAGMFVRVSFDKTGMRA